MTYELIERGGHACVLPDASGFRNGDVIRCTVPVLRFGYESACGRYWERYATFWGNTPQWRPWAAGW